MEIDAGISQASAISAAWRGVDHFEGAPIRDIRTLVNWNATPVHILVRRSVGAANVTELGNARIECITPGDGIELSTRTILGAVGISFEDSRIEYSGNRIQAASRFHTGGVDAIFDGTGIGAAWMTDIIGDGSTFELLSLTDEQIAAIIAVAPDMREMVIPAGSYAGQNEDVFTVGNWTTLYVHESMDEEVAYNITRSIIENKEALLMAHSFFADLAPENILDVVAPLHPGAERFFREIGVIAN
jgi:TRAP transporter TAXI family solute receptor